MSTVTSVETPDAARRLGCDVTIENLSVSYGDFDALRDVSVHIPAGTTLALVGESGSGKSTLALAASRLLPPEASITSGTVTVGDTELVGLRGTALRRARGRVSAYLAQDALAALNPVMRVGLQVAEVYRRRDGMNRSDAQARAVQALEDVNIVNPARVARQYAHQLSGGMRQRVMIAMALAFRPEVLVADEPTTALDVTVQAEILRLVSELQQRDGLTVVWITHDMSVVAEIADTVGVVYGGRLVEHSDVVSIFDQPRHPYTKALLACFGNGRATKPKELLQTIPGHPPNGEIPPGCPFHPRCTSATDECRTELVQPLFLKPRHRVACFHPLEIS